MGPEIKTLSKYVNLQV